MSDFGISHGTMSVSMPKHEIRKRCLSDLVHLIPSPQQITAPGESQKKRKSVCESGSPQPISAQLKCSICITIIGLWLICQS
jgi:hypothetical protein